MRNLITESIRRQRITLSKVFPLTGFPAYTYVAWPALENKFQDALEKVGLSILLLGPAGCGKTCLLQAMFAKHKKNTIWYYCRPDSTVHELLFVLMRKSASLRQARRLVKTGLMPKDSNDDLFFVHSVMEVLARKKKYIVLENLHELPEEMRRFVGQLLKLACDMSVKVAVSAIAPNAHELSIPEHLIRHRLQIIHMSHFQNAKKHALIRKIEQALNIAMQKELRHDIVSQCYTAAECIRACFNICSVLNIKRRQKQLQNIVRKNGVIFLE